MNEIVRIPLAKLHPHPDNPRKDLGDLTELAASIKTNGILQNLTVIPGHRATDEELERITKLYDSMDETTDIEIAAKEQVRKQLEDRWAYSDYTVIIGHRRSAAAKLAGLTEVPCTIVEMTPREQVQTMLLENIQRSDLTVYEQAQGFQMMLDLGATVEEISEKSGFSETTVRRRVKMMELDQKILREVADRQISLGDFDTLAQIENIKDRNECLEKIGTRDFEFSVQRAMRQQSVNHNMPIVKKWLKDRKAKKITSSESWSNNYDSLGSYLYIAKWGEAGNKPPEKLPAELFYTLDNDCVRLFKKHEKAKPEKRPPEEIAKEKAIAEAWKSLEETVALALDLRKAFVEKLKVTGKNRQAVLRGALLACVLGSVEYNSTDRDAICKVFEIERGYDPERGRKLIANLDHITDETLPTLVYASFGDDARERCTDTGSKRDFPRYQPSIKLILIYDWLESLGYERSTDETEMLNGTHAAFEARKAFEEGA